MATLMKGWLRILMAYEALRIQLDAYKELTESPIYLPDDATEEELAELAAERRALRGVR